jgi:CheY-like chemotaxis protein
VVRAAADAVRPAAEAKELAVVLDLDPRVGPISGDADRLQQIVWNLLTNSVKFTPKAGRISVSLTAEGSDAVLVVADNGSGISPDLLPHVFERFRQGTSSASRAHGGLGIGLALVRHLADLHGGTALAESEGEGRGATFTVRLPMLGSRAVSEPNTLPGAEGAANKATALALDRVAILVVEDDDDARDLIATTLRYAGAQVATAPSANAAVELLESSAPDLIVSDIAMPDGTGYDLVKQVRATPRLSRIPAIALTAYGRVEDRDRALDAGFNYHIVKPVEPSHLVHAVATALGRA